MGSPTENRGSRRRTVSKVGEIVFNAGSNRMACTVRDITGRGARLEVGSSASVPDSFALVLPNTLRQPCRVVWRKGRELGVSFM